MTSGSIGLSFTPPVAQAHGLWACQNRRGKAKTSEGGICEALRMEQLSHHCIGTASASLLDIHHGPRRCRPAPWCPSGCSCSSGKAWLSCESFVSSTVGKGPSLSLSPQSAAGLADGRLHQPPQCSGHQHSVSSCPFARTQLHRARTGAGAPWQLPCRCVGQSIRQRTLRVACGRGSTQLLASQAASATLCTPVSPRSSR